LGKKYLGNTRDWAKSFLRTTEISLFHKVRSYFQKKAFFNHIHDKNMVIVDVGCGNGGFVNFLEKEGYHNVFGVEPNDELLERINKPNIQKGFSNSLPHKDQFADCINFFCVLHHLKNIRDYELTLDEIDRCLKPGGIIIIIEPCRKLIYLLWYKINRLLSPFSANCSNIYNMLNEEMTDLCFFFDHSEIIKTNLLKKNYTLLKNKKVLHVWTLIMQKQKNSTTVR